MKEKVGGIKDYEDTDNKLAFDIKRTRLQCFGKHPHGSMFPEVVVFSKDLSEWNFLLISGMYSIYSFSKTTTDK